MFHAINIKWMFGILEVYIFITIIMTINMHPMPSRYIKYLIVFGQFKRDGFNEEKNVIIT